MEKILFFDEETNEKVEFAVEEETQLNGVKYVLVSDDEGEATILKEIKTEDDEVVYQLLEDDVEFSALAKVFSELLDDETELDY